MTSHTKLNRHYWRYLIKVKGKNYCRSKFEKVINDASGDRKRELINIYIEVFSARA